MRSSWKRRRTLRASRRAWCDPPRNGSRSAYLDLASPAGQDRADTLLAGADVVVNNHRSGGLERHGLNPRRLAERHPGLVYVSVTCYGSRGPWAWRGGLVDPASRREVPVPRAR